jgi:uncharacterized protein
MCGFSMYNFTPWSSLGGGVLIGFAALLLLAGLGRIAGYSGIISCLLTGHRGRWRALFLAGTVLGASVAYYVFNLHSVKIPFSLTLLFAGLLVGFGSRLANGCTSGHGICGIGRFSFRSVVATCLFMLSGAFIVAIIK